MKIDDKLVLESNGGKGIINLSDRWITQLGKIKRNITMTIEVPVLFYSNNPAGGEVSANYIGAFTYFNYNPEVRNVSRIGRFCSVGQNVSIGIEGHSTTAISHHQIFERKQFWAEPYWDYDREWVNDNFKKNLEKEPKRLKPAVVGNDVWIGCNAIILNGVDIGDGAIIAAGAVVTKDVPPYTIVAGVPAKVIRKRFSDEVIERLLRIKWWEYGPDVLRELNISEPEQCIDELENRINGGIKKYQPDKFEFNLKEGIISKIRSCDNEKELVYKGRI